MRFRVRKAAHVFERVGLAMAGAACGLFVSAHVGSAIGALTSQAFLLVMMVAGAVAFYLRIDTPQLAFHDDDDGGIDAADLLTSVGTFLATLAAFVSVGIIILREEPRIAWTWVIFACWVFGIAMQIVAGAKARMR
jgi:mannose/fructose/N-acetylgalactosamine-specific phosphotransferase system component IID